MVWAGPPIATARSIGKNTESSPLRLVPNHAVPVLELGAWPATRLRKSWESLAAHDWEISAATIRATFPPVSMWALLTGAGTTGLTIEPGSPRSISIQRQMPSLKGMS